MPKFKALIFCITLLGSVNSLCADPKCPNISPSIGQCVRVGTEQLFMNVQGKTGPVVVFESGRGDTHEVWKQVTPLISPFARAVSYDRANLGYSQNLPDPNQPFAAKQIAEDLHTLLHAAKLLPPYILVGHSSGGLYVQMFARLYPKEVSGIVFVDSSSIDQTLNDPLPPKTDAAYPESFGFWLSQEQVQNAPPFPAIPIIVLTASYHGSANPKALFHLVSENGQPTAMTEAASQTLWESYQDKIAALSPNSVHMYAYGSGHYIQTAQPHLVADAVYTLIKEDY